MTTPAAVILFLGCSIVFGVFEPMGKFRSGLFLIQLICFARTLHINRMTLPPSIAQYFVYTGSKIGSQLI